MKNVVYLLYSRSGETDVVGIRLVSGVGIVESQKVYNVKAIFL